MDKRLSKTRIYKEKLPSICLWGMGSMFEFAMSVIDKKKCIIHCIVDIQAKRKTGGGIPIVLPEEIDNICFDYLIIVPKNTEDIERICKEKKIPSAKIIFLWKNKSKEYDFIDFKRVKIIQQEVTIKKLSIRLSNAPFEFGSYNGPIIKSDLELLHELILNSKSLCRFGDGELDIMRLKKSVWFQNPEKNLSKKLFQVIQTKNNDVCIALSNNFGNLNTYTEKAADSIRGYMSEGNTRNEVLKLVSCRPEYYDAYVTRPYMMYKDKSHAKEVFNLWKKLWKGKSIFIVEGCNSRMGVFNDLFSNCRKICRLLCPASNAFEKYDEIYASVLKYAKKDDLVLISLGATATVMAYELALAGYQAIDIGQLDNEYDWFLMGAKERCAIPWKCVAEISWAHNPEPIDCEEYARQLIHKIE